MTTGTLALIILGVILVQVAIVMLLIIHRRKREYQELDRSKDASPAVISTPSSLLSKQTAETVASCSSWEGYREFSVQRKEFEDNNKSICSFYLVPLDSKPLPVFNPGQFLTFKLLLEDPVTYESKTIVRCYSLSDAPRSDYYRISIKRVPAPASQPDVPPGLSSSFFHDHIKEGSKILVKAASGHFHLIEEEELLPIVLIGGGIGITPMLSILNTVLERGVKTEVWLYYGIPSSDEHIMKAHLQVLARTHDNFHLHVCYSAPNESDAEGIDYQHNTWVGIPLLRGTLKLMRYQFYVCGPKPMMESLLPGLEGLGVNSNDIYYESFGPATLIKHKKTAPAVSSEQPVNITFTQTAKTILWDPAADSLLEFAEANGIEVESSCRAGNCGSCQTTVKAGEVDYNQEPDADLSPGHCLLCISKPKNDLTLEL
ncbi:MAG: 2Fe-2S iron-sulfur cluster binding domain-containing protein [Thiohalomonas sp.]|nr:2Fe-2S iron-sulfur cluster binding domain-containing protein [Thiohalomonas sp.]